MAGNNVKYKLRNLYAKIERSGKCGFNSFEEFRHWSFNNGYKPWKVLSLLDDESNYSADNCTWSLDRRGSKSAVTVKDDRSLDNIVKNVKILACESLEVTMNLDKMENICNDLVDMKLIDRNTGMDLLRSLRLARTYTSDVYNSLDKLSINGLTAEDLGGDSNENK